MKGALDGMRAMREAQHAARTGGKVPARPGLVGLNESLAKASAKAPRRLAKASDPEVAGATSGLAGLIAEIRLGVEAGEDDLTLLRRARGHIARQGGRARAAKLSPERKHEIAKGARAARSGASNR